MKVKARGPKNPINISSQGGSKSTVKPKRYYGRRRCIDCNAPVIPGDWRCASCS